MSRYRLKAKEQGIVLGWHNPLRTFFAQVWGPDKDEPVLWLGTSREEVPAVYAFDLLVSPNLNGRGYGLIALRDVMRNFELVTEGDWVLDEDGTPLSTPNLVLDPRERLGGRSRKAP